MTVFPNFLVIGAQKAGTTWLAARLREHPDIFMRKGEIHFFDVEDNFQKGPEWYSEQFKDGENHQARGEKTPDYLWVNRDEGRRNDIPVRIHDCVPDAKIIIVLRDPVMRAISALNHQIVARRLSPFVNADEILLGEDAQIRKRFGMLSRGYYAQQIREYQKYFKDILVLIFEQDIINNPIKTLSDISQFLNLEADFQNPKISKRENSGMHSRLGQVLNYYTPRAELLIAGIDRFMPKSRPVSPSPEALQELYRHFAPDNEKLEEVLGRSLQCWNEAEDR